MSNYTVIWTFALEGADDLSATSTNKVEASSMTAVLQEFAEVIRREEAEADRPIQLLSAVMMSRRP